nr:hypothetical protein [Microbacterium sp. NIBRBAC000506063]
MGIVPASGEAASTAPHGEPGALLIPERSSDDAVVVTVVELDSAGAEIARAQHEPAEAIAAVRAAEASGPPRWVLRRTGELLPMLLRAGVVVSKVWDLDLCHEIIRNADRTDRPLPPWTRPPVEEQSAEPALFELSEAADEATGDDIETDAAASLAQFRAQRERAAQDPRLLLLCHAESAGAVVAEEMRVAGVPWDAGVHDELLTRMLGPRSSATGVPARMAELAAEVRMHLDDPRLNIDSPPKLLRALHRVGILVGSTSRWELAEHEHPAIEPLLAYKKLSRLHTANGWGGWRNGCTRAGSGPSTCPAAWSPGDGPRPAAARSSCLAVYVRPCERIPAGGSSWPTSPSSSLVCSPRCPAIWPWRRPRAAPISTRASWPPGR